MILGTTTAAMTACRDGWAVMELGVGEMSCARPPIELDVGMAVDQPDRCRLLNFDIVHGYGDFCGIG